MKKNEIAGIITSKSDIQTSLRLLIHHQPPNAFKPISRCLHIKETFKQALAFYFEATLRQFYLQKKLCHYLSLTAAKAPYLLLCHCPCL